MRSTSSASWTGSGQRWSHRQENDSQDDQSQSENLHRDELLAKKEGTSNRNQNDDRAGHDSVSGPDVTGREDFVVGIEGDHTKEQNWYEPSPVMIDRELSEEEQIGD